MNLSLMNMRKYYVLTLRRYKGLFISDRRCVHQTSYSATEPRYVRRHPPPPSSSYLRNAFVSPQPTHSNLIRNHYTLKFPYNQDASPLDYQVTVKGREVISAAVNQHWLPLSNLDLLLPRVEAGVFFCYKRKDMMSPETVVNTIKRSLAGILSTFYPLTGEIVANSQGEPEVVCNNCGVEFVHAHADVELKDLDWHHPDDTVKGKLIPNINRGLLSVQATELNCGAIIISCAVDHRVADGYSLKMFLVAWAMYAQSETISHMPSFRPSLLNPRHPPTYETNLDNFYVPISSLPPPSSFDQEPLQSRMYYIHAESIAKLQSEASSKETKRSKLVSFTAFLWKLLAHGDDTTSRMGMVVNGRPFLTQNSEERLETHFGNVLSVPYGVATNSDLKALPLNEVADGVHRFVSEATNEEHFRGLIDWVELHRPKPAIARICMGLEGTAAVVSSGRDLPVKEMEFGWGKPEFGSFHFPWGSQTGYITTMPSAKKIGDWVVYMHLKQKDLNVIESMASHVIIPLTHSLLFE